MVVWGSFQGWPLLFLNFFFTAVYGCAYINKEESRIGSMGLGRSIRTNPNEQELQLSIGRICHSRAGQRRKDKNSAMFSRLAAVCIPYQPYSVGHEHLALFLWGEEMHDIRLISHAIWRRPLAYGILNCINFGFLLVVRVVSEALVVMIASRRRGQSPSQADVKLHMRTARHDGMMIFYLYISHHSYLHL